MQKKYYYYKMNYTGNNLHIHILTDFYDACIRDTRTRNVCMNNPVLAARFNRLRFGGNDNPPKKY